MNAHWSLGVLIGLPILLLLTLALIVGGALLRRMWQANPNSFDAGTFHGASWIAFGVAALVVLIGAVGFFPYSVEYHKWQPTTGTVGEVSKRLVGSGSDGMSEKIVVQYTDGRERGCNDTRCSLIKPGDVLTLSCKRSWQWASTPGWDCNFVSRQAVTR